MCLALPHLESAPSLILVKWKSQPQVSIQASVLYLIVAVVRRGVTAGLVLAFLISIDKV